MSLYAVKNDKGEYLDGECFSGEFGPIAATAPSRGVAVRAAAMQGGTVVELTESPDKVVVSEEEAEILKKLDREIRTKSTGYSPWKWLSKLDDLGMAVEDAYKALAIGWTVEKPKRWNVKVPHMGGYYCKSDDGLYAVHPYPYNLNSDEARFTQAEIDQYGLGDCQKTEVEDDED